MLRDFLDIDIDFSAALVEKKKKNNCTRFIVTVHRLFLLRLNYHSFM